MKFKQFRMSKGVVNLSSPSGHMASIGYDFVSLPEILWADAYAKGCQSEDMQSADMTKYLEEKQKELKKDEDKELIEIKNSLKVVLDNPSVYVDSSGKLVYRKIISIIGKPIRKDIVDKLWAEIVSEME